MVNYNYSQIRFIATYSMEVWRKLNLPKVSKCCNNPNVAIIRIIDFARSNDPHAFQPLSILHARSSIYKYRTRTSFNQLNLSTFTDFRKEWPIMVGIWNLNKDEDQKGVNEDCVTIDEY